MIETAVFGVFYRASDRLLVTNEVASDGTVRQASQQTSRKPITSVLPHELAPVFPNSSIPQPTSEPLVFPRYAGPVEPPLPEIDSRLIIQEPGSGQQNTFDSESLADSMVACQADQLGLAHPAAISLKVRLPGSESLELDATGSGVYRPTSLNTKAQSEQARNDVASEQVGLASGTQILTSRGEMEVQDLIAGDIVLALRGPALLPLLRVGKAAYTRVSVAIEAAALGPDLPRRLLRVGPNQPIFLDPAPVAAYTLVNGGTIRFVDDDVVELFCVNFGEAEIVLAEGVPLASADQIGNSYN